MSAQVSSTLVCALHRMLNLKLLIRLAMGVHVHVLARRWLLCAYASCGRAASRGIFEVRACKQVRLLVVGCLCLLALQCFAACRCLIIIITACIIIIIFIINNS
jgi:hypothetical protein